MTKLGEIPRQYRDKRGRNSQKPDWMRRRNDPEINVKQEADMAVKESAVKQCILSRVKFSFNSIRGQWYHRNVDSSRYCVEVATWGDPILVWEKGHWYYDSGHGFPNKHAVSQYVLDNYLPGGAQPMSWEDMVRLREYGIAGVAMQVDVSGESRANWASFETHKLQLEQELDLIMKTSRR